LFKKKKSLQVVKYCAHEIDLEDLFSLKTGKLWQEDDILLWGLENSSSPRLRD